MGSGSALRSRCGCSIIILYIYIDFSKAFDSVVHSKLIYKLSNFGINGKLLDWLNAFLTNRLQCVVVEHCCSEWSAVTSGIPQGTVLGPLLFILFVDDVSQICLDSTVTHKLFADDLKLYTSIRSNCDSTALQLALDRLQHWCNEWQLTINTEKCHLLHIGASNQKTQYFLNGRQVNASNVVADLGVDIDHVLRYDCHINKIIGKAYARVGILFKGFATRNINILKQAFITYVRPVLEYASSVWSPHLIKHINAIERVQKRFTKRIPELSKLSYAERLACISLEPLELRRLKIDLLLYYKCFNGLVDLPSNHYFSISERSSQTRSGGYRLNMQLCHTNRFENSFFNRCLACWNALPDNIINANSVNSFKLLLNNYDLSAYMHCGYF